MQFEPEVEKKKIENNCTKKTGRKLERKKGAKWKWDFLPILLCNIPISVEKLIFSVENLSFHGQVNVENWTLSSNSISYRMLKAFFQVLSLSSFPMSPWSEGKRVTFWFDRIPKASVVTGSQVIHIKDGDIILPYGIS